MTTLHEPALTTPAEPAVWPASTTEPRPGDLTVGGVSLAEVADRFGTAGGRRGRRGPRGCWSAGRRWTASAAGTWGSEFTP